MKLWIIIIALISIGCTTQIKWEGTPITTPHDVHGQIGR